MDLIAFFIREMKELYSGMLSDRRNAAATEFPSLDQIFFKTGRAKVANKGREKYSFLET